MNREELERLTKPELIDLLLGLQRPDKTSRTSSNPPSTDRKGKRVGSRPGGAKPGHKGHARALAETADAHEDHRPAHCQHCGLPFVEDAMGEVVGEYDEIDLPEVKPIIRRHRRMTCRCATCGKATSAPMPQAAQGTPFGRQIHALALYLKSNQLFSYQRLQGVFGDLFGLDISQGALMNMFKRTAPIFAARRDDALVALRRAEVVACDETGMRIEGCNGYQWVFCAPDAVFSRAAQVVGDTMAGHQPDVWISDRYSGQQGHGLHHQTCLAHLDRKARFLEQHGIDLIGMRLKLWLDRAFGFARDQLLTFCDFPGKVDATNNVSERALRPSVIQRKFTNGYRAKWAADAEADLRTTVDTARLSGANPFQTTLGAVSA
jgi:transposase